MNKSDIHIGQKWQDADPRLPERIVTVTHVDETTVEYTYKNRKSKSNKDRFLKAFRFFQES